ncbi:HlyD family type I secretion periplasmic adaptor subunit [Anaerovibrio sp.]|uniref:HlyD family type I secretion periplasmic adaptor subunit n=1 Tax=Anaerovibrio sp. TaxID=1872532 RepID=UPI003F18C3BC
MWERLRLYLDRWTANARAGKKGELTAQEREFFPPVLEMMAKPPAPAARKLLWVLIALLIAAVLWLCFGHVDEVAVAEGKVIPSGEAKVVQAEDKGVIRNILVVEGQYVHKGDLLVELDTTMTQADLDNLRHRAAYYEADIKRLLAEQSGSGFELAEDSFLEGQDRLFQQNLYSSRMAHYRSRLAEATYNLRQQEAALDAERSGYEKLSRLYVIAREKNDRVMKLADENAISTFTVLEYQAKAVELEEDLRGQAHKIEKAAWSARQARQQLEELRAEHDKEITAMLVESRRQLASCQEELKKAEEKKRLSMLCAPIDGRIAHLGVHTVGGVVTPAQALMEVVPESAKLEVEAWVQNRDIGFVQVGQPAEVKIEAFSFQKYGTLHGSVESISPDAMEDKDKGRRYRVVIELEEPQFQLRDRTADIASGMTASAEIKIRQKRIIEFFLDPFRQYRSEALRER